VAAIEVVVGVPMAAALGFACGTGPCLVSCLPYLAPVFLATDGGIRKSWRIILPLALGRLLGYTLFGWAAGVLGSYAQDGIGTEAIRTVAGCAALLIGLAIWLRPTPRGTCGKSLVGRRCSDSPSPLLPGGLFVMGLAMALNPCAPLGVVLFSAAMAGSAGHGLLLGAGFGLGAIVIPSLVYGIGVAYLGTRLREQLRSWLPALENVSALLLIAVGLNSLLR
jgi:cytochrome c biogenesis protein CcdA